MAKTTIKKKDSPVFDYRSIKTVDDAFKRMNLQRPILKDFPAMIPQRHCIGLLAAYELFVCFEAINDDWKADYSNWDQPKYYPWVEINASSSFISMVR